MRALHARAVGELERVAEVALDGDAGADHDALGAVERRHPGAGTRAEDAGQRPRRGLDHGHLDAERPCRGGGLEPDQARAHDGQRAAVQQGGAESFAVERAAQHLRARHAGQRPRAGARGDQQLVVVQPLAVGERDGAPPGVERARGDAEPQLDVVVGVPARGPEGGVDLSEQTLLRQRRAVVRAHGLVADDGHRTVVAGGPQHLDAALGGESPAHDQQFHGRSIGTAPQTDRQRAGKASGKLTGGGITKSRSA